MSKIWRAKIITLIAALMLTMQGGSPSLALTPEERLDDPRLEQRARDLSLQLRCLVCQNQSIDDSDAPFAQDLRRLIRRDIEAGKSDDDIIAFLRQRYGDYVLLNPPLTSSTYLLWIAPFAILGLGIGIVFLSRRKQHHENEADERKDQ
jgi:cytochrome c-type biogenesis protein CcmH